MVDFVRQTGDFEYEPVEGPKHATHTLCATSWNTKDKFRPNSKGKIVQPDGDALSVLAKPLVIRLHKTTLKVKRRFPTDKATAAYNAKSPVTAKRRVLRGLVDAMGAPAKFRRLLKKFGDVDCDTLYRTLIRASRIKFYRS